MKEVKLPLTVIFYRTCGHLLTTVVLKVFRHDRERQRGEITVMGQEEVKNEKKLDIKTFELNLHQFQ